MASTRYRSDALGFEILLPNGWLAEPDEEEGVLIRGQNSHGMLHVMRFDRDADEEIDPGDELYAFLDEQDVQLEDDEVEDYVLPSGVSMATCQYIEEEVEEEEDGEVHWLLAVLTRPGTLLFASYSCPAGLESEEIEQVQETLQTICFV